jgi:Ca-activated chloride channel family protein
MTRCCALLAILSACGGSDEPAPPAIVAPSPAAPRPAPGVDLPDDLAMPSVAAPGVHRSSAAAPALLALAADRAVQHADVPTPPRGANLAFQLPDDHAAWITAIPDAVQLPAAAYGDGRVYVSGGFESVTFYALDAQTGKIAWATSHLEDNGPTAAVFEHGRVLFNTESCTLFALDAKTGKRLWHRFLGDPTLAQIAVADDLVYSAHPSPDGQQLTAYRVSTGDAVWSHAVATELLAGPVISGDTVYASTVGGVTFAFDRATGAQRWAKHLGATTAPWVANGELYATRASDDHHEQQLVVSAATGEVLHAQHATAAANDAPVDISVWKNVWAFEGSRPVVDRGIRYDAVGRELRATDAETGDVLWERTSDEAGHTRDFGSVAFSGSAVVVATRSGKVYGLDVDTGYTLWSYDVGHGVAAEPIIAKGWVYVTTLDGYVIGLHVGDDTLDGWHMFGGNPQHDGAVVAGDGPA